MNIEIKPLAPELAEDYFDFFENRAFTDDSPYRCYCQVYQQTEDTPAYCEDPGLAARRQAERQIAAGVLRGYLAYDKGAVIGWINVNDRANYVPAHMHKDEPGIEKAVTCFEIAPGYRGRGIATALLDRAIADARAEGFSAIEGYPVIRTERFEWDCTGPMRLYEKAGFAPIEARGEITVVRKNLDAN